MSAWERISSFGIGDTASAEGRRRRLTNQSAAMAVLSFAGFAAAFLAGGERFRGLAIVNLVALPFVMAVPFVARSGHQRTARATLIVAVNLVALVASAVMVDCGFHYYFFVAGTAGFLLFDADSRSKWSLAALSIACAVVARVVAVPPSLTIRLSDEVSTTIEIGSQLAVFGTLLFVAHNSSLNTSRAEAKLAVEHERSERLLLNVLPAAISARLKDHHGTIADAFPDVTVLFADLVGFTELSQTLTPDELVKVLDEIFSAFDGLAEELGLEKIKTIGDCYMVAAGLPEPKEDHVAAIARMALGMRAAIEALDQARGYTLKLRIGVHCGPVVAGVIGKRKFIYDLWGDTVNTASRMESSGVPQEIQVTREVRERLGDRFELTARGEVAVKGKGTMETYFLRAERPTA